MTPERLAAIEQLADELQSRPLHDGHHVEAMVAIRELLAAEAQDLSWRKDADYFRFECDRIRAERDALQRRVEALGERA